MNRIEITRNNSSSLPSSSNTTPALRTLDSFAATNVSFALSGVGGEGNSSDAWTQISIRCLPLFNGEGYKGYIEDLNELVRIHVQRTIGRAQQLLKSRSRQSSSQADIYPFATGLLVADLSEFILTGCLTLSASLSLRGHHLLTKLNEVWLFFYTGVLPALEGIFVFLRSDERLRVSTERNSEGSSSEVGAIDIRRLALIGFRDHVIIPRIDHLAGLFQDLYTSGSSSESISRSNTPPVPPIQSQPSSLSPTRSRTFSTLPATTTNIPSPLSDSAGFSLHNTSSSSPSLPSPILIPLPTANPSNISTPIPSPPHSNSVNTQAENARRRQMVSILASSLTDDDRQSEMDALLRMMKLGATNSFRDRPRASNRSWIDENRGREEDLTGTPFSQDSSQFTSSSVPA